MIKIIFNSTTNIVGGGIKNAILFIEQSWNDKEYDWFYFVSKKVFDGLSEKIRNSEKIFLFETSPSKSLKSRREIKKLFQKINPKLVYTMSGPAYLEFKPCIHIQGISNAYITHPLIEDFLRFGNLYRSLKKYLSTIYQSYYALKADYFVFQTSHAETSFRKKFKISNSKTYVISNAYDSNLKAYFDTITPKNSDNKRNINIFCPGAAYIHKGFQFIPSIAEELRRVSDYDIKFVLTLPHHDKLWISIQKTAQNKGVSDIIVNNGPFAYRDLSQLLEHADIVFVPSLFETFSASYIEAMCAAKTLVVADKHFARDICQDYAFYLDPRNPKEAAQTLLKSFSQISDITNKRKKAEKILQQYGNQEDKFYKIKKMIKKTIKEKN